MSGISSPSFNDLKKEIDSANSIEDIIRIKKVLRLKETSDYADNLRISEKRCCPNCQWYGNSELRSRKTMNPKYRCSKCTHEFDDFGFVIYYPDQYTGDRIKAINTHINFWDNLCYNKYLDICKNMYYNIDFYISMDELNQNRIIDLLNEEVK